MMDLDPLARTALIPFWSRACDAVAPRPILGDAAAAALAPRVRDLFGEAAVSRSTQAGCCLRNLVADRWLSELADSTTIIVEIGAGLNTRIHRLSLPARQYVEVDLNPIMTMRDELVPTGGATRVAGDGMDVDHWVTALELAARSRVIITLEGVLAYQAPDSVERFFANVALACPGAYIVFDRLSPTAVSRANRPRARFDDRPEYRWPVRGRDRELGDDRLKVLSSQGFMDLPLGLRRHLPLKDRVMHSLPSLRGAYKLLLCQLAQAGEEA